LSDIIFLYFKIGIEDSFKDGHEEGKSKQRKRSQTSDELLGSIVVEGEVSCLPKYSCP
jgi:hypothetical protein